MTQRTHRVLAFAAAFVLVFATVGTQPVAAQELRVSTPYPSVAVEAGDRVTLDIEVFAPDPTAVQLSVTSAPDEWETSLRGGGFVIGGVYAHPEAPPEVELETSVPADVAEGSYTVEVSAEAGDVSDALVIEFVVEDAVAGEASLHAEFPTLRGPADTEFSFDVDLDNATPQEHTFALEAVGPEGWQVTASPSGESTASTVTVAGGDTEGITVEAVPPPGVTAGQYPLLLRATGGGERVELELEAEITGTFDVALTTDDERLSVETSPGREATVTLIVQNQGSADLTEVSLDASSPQGWDASFAPDVLEIVPAGERAEVEMTIAPAEDAIIGDYRITVTADATETADEVDVRVTVETSRAWGAVGVALIVAALGGLGWVFRTFGRR